MEVRINDAPKANEILVAIAVPFKALASHWGLTHEEAEGRWFKLNKIKWFVTPISKNSCSTISFSICNLSNDQSAVRD